MKLAAYQKIFNRKKHTVQDKTAEAMIPEKNFA